MKYILSIILPFFTALGMEIEKFPEDEIKQYVIQVYEMRFHQYEVNRKALEKTESFLELTDICPKSVALDFYLKWTKEHPYDSNQVIAKEFFDSYIKTRPYHSLMINWLERVELLYQSLIELKGIVEYPMPKNNLDTLSSLLSHLKSYKNRILKAHPFKKNCSPYCLADKKMPKNWPIEIQYTCGIFNVEQNKLVCPYDQCCFNGCKKCKINKSVNKDSCNLSKQIFISLVDENHPAFPGRGVFAIDNMPKNTFIGYYTGLFVEEGKHVPKRGKSIYGTKFSKNYCAGVNVLVENNGEMNQVDRGIISADICGNEMRFCNSYKGIALARNAKMYSAEIVNGQLFIPCFTVKKIKKGEEILLDYENEAYHQMFLNTNGGSTDE